MLYQARRSPSSSVCWSVNFLLTSRSYLSRNSSLIWVPCASGKQRLNQRTRTLSPQRRSQTMLAVVGQQHPGESLGPIYRWQLKTCVGILRDTDGEKRLGDGMLLSTVQSTERKEEEMLVNSEESCKLRRISVHPANQICFIFGKISCRTRSPQRHFTQQLWTIPPRKPNEIKKPWCKGDKTITIGSCASTTELCKKAGKGTVSGQQM